MLKKFVPSRGYATIGLKPAILGELQKITDEFYPGMFLPSTLIILMNEIKVGYYSVDLYSLKEDFSGRYTSLTLRSDVKAWLDNNFVNLKEEYFRKYRISSFTQFASIFLLNVFESKRKSREYVIRLKGSDFNWLTEEYEKRKHEYEDKYSVNSFEQFADVFLKDLLERVNSARKLLSI